MECKDKLLSSLGLVVVTEPVVRIKHILDKWGGKIGQRHTSMLIEWIGRIE